PWSTSGSWRPSRLSSSPAGAIRPGGYYFGRARILFRRPSFTGEWYRRTARRFAGPEGEDLVIGSIHCVPGPDRPLTGAPAAVVQLYARKSLPSSSRSDKNG